MAEAQGNCEFMVELLQLIADQDDYDQIFWMDRKDGLVFYINCNDIFLWGMADGEEVTPETLPELRKAYEDANQWGGILYCARIRKMRPQGAAYKYIPDEYKELFDACGPERDVQPGNPVKR